MSELMVKMAKRASEDNSLMASLISHYAETKGLRWEDIAAHLWIDNLKLAKLALCRRPSQSNFTKEISQISDYVGVEDRRLVDFIRAAEGAQLANIAKQQNETRRRPFWQTWRNLPIWQTLRSRPVWQTRGLALSFAFAVLFLILLGSFMLLSPGQNGSTLAVLNGQVSVVRLDKLFYIVPRYSDRTIREGEDFTAKAGDTISGGKDAPAELRLADGSTVKFLEDTKLVINRLFISDEAYQVSLRTLYGGIENRVVSSLKANDVYEIVTPSSTVRVRGTVFTVRVLSPEWSYVACHEGIVEVKTGDYVVQLQPGEEVYVKVSQLPVVQPLGSAPPQDAFEAPSEEDLSSTEPPALAPDQGTQAPGTPPQGTPAPGGVDPNGGISPAPGETEAPSIDDGSSTDPVSPPDDDDSKQVPGKPPDNAKPEGGGEPPGQTKKDDSKKDKK